MLRGLYLAQGVPAALVSQSAPASDDWIDILFRGGPFAIVLLLIIMDKIGTHGERDRLRKENAELRDEIRSLNSSIRQEIVPPLVETTRLLPQVVSALERRRPS